LFHYFLIPTPSYYISAALFPLYVILEVQYSQLLSTHPPEGKCTQNRFAIRYNTSHPGRISNLAFKRTPSQLSEKPYAAQLKVIE
jgi:hypothetical protein